MDRFKTGAPSWWYGAPLIGVLFGFVANRFFPDFVASSAALIYRLSGNGQPAAAVGSDSVRFLAPLVGTLLAVLALAAVEVVKRLTRIRKHVVRYALIEITPMPFGPLLSISVVAGMSAPLIALVLATAAPNKVAGLAVVKVLNGVNLLPIASYFLPTPAQYLAGVIPTYWPMRAFWSAARHESYAVYLGIGCLVGASALAVATHLFERQLLRRA